MQVLVAVPGSVHLEGLSPVLGALGERVIRTSVDPSGVNMLSPSAILGAFQRALGEADGSAIITTSHTPAWAALDTLLNETSQRRALVFFEPAGLSIARSLAAEGTSYEAADEWAGYARGLLEFMRTNRRLVTLVDLDAAYQSTRSLLGICADRFLFDVVDRTAEAPMPSAPDPAFQLLAEELVRQTPDLMALERRLNDEAVPLAERYTGRRRLDVDYLSTERQMLLQARKDLERLEVEAAALRETTTLAQEKVVEVNSQIARHRSVLKQLAPAMDAATIGAGDLREHIIELESRLKRMTASFLEIQEIAERSSVEALNEKMRASDAWRNNVRLQSDVDALKASIGQYEAEAKDARAELDAMREAWKTGLRGLLKTAYRRLPLTGSRETGRKLVKQSGYFDAAWYLKTYEDVAALGTDPLRHFLLSGGKEGRSPGPKFSSPRYLRDNPDVAKAGLNPLVHYLGQGQAEGRKAHPAE